MPYHTRDLPQHQGWILSLPTEKQCDTADRTAHCVCVNQHQPNRAHSWPCPCPPSAGERRLCLTSVRGICGKYRYSQENHISSEEAAGPSGCYIGHGHKRGVCAQPFPGLEQPQRGRVWALPAAPTLPGSHRRCQANSRACTSGGT